MQYSSRAADRESEVFGKLFGIAELHIYLLYYIQILYIIAYNIAIIYCKKMDMSIHICKKQKNAGKQPAFFVCRFLKLRQENGFFLKYVDNNDTVSNGFIWFHLKMKPWHGK